MFGRIGNILCGCLLIYIALIPMPANSNVPVAIVCINNVMLLVGGVLLLRIGVGK